MRSLLGRDWAARTAALVGCAVATACGGGSAASGDGAPSGEGGGASGNGGAVASGGALASGGSSVGGAAKSESGASGDGASSGGTSSGGASSGGPAANGGSLGAGGVSAQTGGTSNGGAFTDAGAGNCTPPPATPLVGWAAVSGTTTGGGDATPTVVTTLDELNAAALGTDPAVVWVRGRISGAVKIGSNKTVIGVCGAELHGHVEISGSQNVIVRNIAIVGYAVGDCALDPKYDSSVGCSSGQDAVSIQKNANHIYIDHADISDGTDGNLDITNGANYVTVSWTKFHYTPRTDDVGSDSTGAAGHRFSNLIGGTDSPKSYDDANALNVTWHHDWWADNVVEREPRVRFGKNHLLNDLWTSSGDNYCVRAGKNAQILVESSVFSGVNSPLEWNSTADEQTASITATNDVFTGTTGAEDTGGGGTPFTAPPYSYAADSTTGLEAAIRAGAGPK